MIFYFGIADTGELHMSPLKDALLEECEILTPGLPLGFARSIFCKVQEKKMEEADLGFWGLGIFGLRIPKLTIWARSIGDGRNNSSSEASFKREIIKVLLKEPGLSSVSWRWEGKKGSEEASAKIREVRREDFLNRTQGRLLAKADLQRLGAECGLAYEVILGLCQEAVLKGEAEWLPAAVKEQGVWQCQRCGETKLEEWTSLYGQTVTCPFCSALGSLSSLHALYRSKNSPAKSDQVDSARGNEVEHIKIEFSPRWELSDAQKLAAQEVLGFVKGNPTLAKGPQKHLKQQTLLWAACGAGKTEVCFPAAAWALEQGKKVLFAAPRQDVVLDVAPRLERDFPGLKAVVLTGISPERFGTAAFVLATTHQILRFYQAFDLIFLDEMDAFPYQGNSALAWGIQQALKPEGKLVYLTATPSGKILDKVEKGSLDIIRLPARHHRRPVPLPQWLKVSGGLDPKHHGKNQESREVFRLVETIAKQGPVLLFVPKISWVKPWVDLIQKEFPQWRVSGSYSADPQRREKIEGLRQGRYQAFVSTSILERGVTIPNAQVLVLEADHEVFDERALVQMAGRVGRTQENPTGTALFLAHRKTPRIEKAISWIIEQNHLAKELGLID